MQWSHKTINYQSGVSSILAIMIVASVIVIGVTVASLVLGEITLSRRSSESATAFYAANAGIERALYACRKQGNQSFGNNSPSCQESWMCETLSNGASYALTGSCGGGSSVITSTGAFREVSRALEANY